MAENFFSNLFKSKKQKAKEEAEEKRLAEEKKLAEEI